jgi:hypothetical protein
MILLKIAKAAAILVLLSSVPLTPVFCQTVGNGTIFTPAAGAKEAYGVNSAESGSSISFPTRHSSGGNGNGIGSSFIGTTSPTSESSPAVARPAFVADTVVQFHLPKLDSTFSQNTSTPALQNFSPSLPSMPRSSALSDPLMNPLVRPNTFQPLDELPSFSKKRSVTDLMRFK